MVILKIPIIYLCSVVYYAIKATPKPEAGASVTAQLGGPDDQGPLRDLDLEAVDGQRDEVGLHRDLGGGLDARIRDRRTASTIPSGIG